MNARPALYTAAAWIGALGSGSYAVEAGVLAAHGDMRAATVSSGWALLGAAMAMAAVMRRRSLQDVAPAEPLEADQ